MNCSWIRWTLARNVDDGQPLSARQERHLAKCDACRAFYENHRCIADRLGAACPAFIDKERTAFKTRILQAVEHRTHKSSVTQRPIPISRYMRPLAAAAAIALVVTATWMTLQRHSAQRTMQLAEVRSSQNTLNLFSELVARDATGNNLLASARQAVQTPVSREVDNLKSDIRRATNRLVSCLPGLPALPSMISAPATPAPTKLACGSRM